MSIVTSGELRVERFGAEIPGPNHANEAAHAVREARYELDRAQVWSARPGGRTWAEGHLDLARELASLAMSHAGAVNDRPLIEAADAVQKAVEAVAAELGL